MAVPKGMKGRWAKLVKIAVEDRIAAIKGLAKKNSAEKYSDEAAVQEADALYLEEEVLKDLQEQLEIPEPIAEVKDLVAQQIAEVCRIYSTEIKTADVRDTMLHEHLATRMLFVMRHACKLSFAAGRQVLEVEDERMLRHALKAGAKLDVKVHGE